MRKKSTKHGCRVLPEADIKLGKVAFPLPFNLLIPGIVSTQQELDEVAEEKKGFHELGVIKMIAHLFIIIVQREMSKLDCVVKFQSVDDSLIQELERLSGPEITDRMMQLKLAQRPPRSPKELEALACDFCAPIGATSIEAYKWARYIETEVISPKALLPPNRRSTSRYLGVLALDLHLNNPGWTYPQIAKHLGYKPRIDVLMKTTEGFLERFGIEVRRQPAAGKTRPEKRRRHTN
jgi:hypothetical protein